MILLVDDTHGEFQESIWEFLDGKLSFRDETERELDGRPINRRSKLRQEHDIEVEQTDRDSGIGDRAAGGSSDGARFRRKKPKTLSSAAAAHTKNKHGNSIPKNWRNKFMARRKRVIARMPIRALMKSQGAEVVAHDAIDQLVAHLEGLLKGTTQRALQFAAHAKRKKVTKDDVTLSIQYGQ